jgi:ribosome-binding protein aMBF1 (putative translation factor)
MNKIPCDMCGAEGEWTNHLRTTAIQKKDGSDIIVCNDCLNDYAHKDFETLLRRAVKNGWLTIER